MLRFLHKSSILITIILLGACATYQGGSSVDPPPEGDPDNDGIKNSIEKKFGTDPYTKDIFIEIDYMVNADSKAGMTLTRHALQLVVNAFAAQDIRVHFDVGEYFEDDTLSSVPQNYDLGGGNEIPYTKYLGVTGATCEDADLDTGETCDADYTTIQELKSEHFKSNRSECSSESGCKYTFHYMVLGDFNILSATTVGLAELPGNDFIVTQGDNLEGDEVTTIGRDNIMAATIMHELGHNLNLTHGGSYGDALTNSKPNYESIMNYVYANHGLNVRSRALQWQQFNADSGYGCDAGDYLTYDLQTIEMELDFSHGTNLDINEREVVELDGFSPDTTIPVDFDCDGNAIENEAYELDLTFDTDSEGALDPSYTVLEDFDDWGNLVLDMSTTSDGIREKAGILSGPGGGGFIECHHPRRLQDVMAEYGELPENSY